MTWQVSTRWFYSTQNHKIKTPIYVKKRIADFSNGGDDIEYFERLGLSNGRHSISYCC